MNSRTHFIPAVIGDKKEFRNWVLGLLDKNIGMYTE
jgi:hypothetical protein